MDTIRITERLSKGGFTEDQAKRIATTFADHLKGKLATKCDLDVLRAELKADIATLRSQLLTAQGSLKRRHHTRRLRA
jgi:hypothetical protein